VRGGVGGVGFSGEGVGGAWGPRVDEGERGPWSIGWKRFRPLALLFKEGKGKSNALRTGTREGKRIPMSLTAQATADGRVFAVYRIRFKYLNDDRTGNP